jgi:hypothetical protein
MYQKKFNEDNLGSLTVINYIILYLSLNIHLLISFSKYFVPNKKKIIKTFKYTAFSFLSLVKTYVEKIFS